MNLRGAIWFSLAWVMLPVGVALGLLFARSEQPAARGYGLAAATSAGSSIVLLAPLAMLLAAIAGRRWERAGWQARSTARLPLLVVADVVWPLAAAAALALLAVLTVAGSGLAGTVAVGLPLTALLVAMVLLGFGLGVRLPLRVCGPLAVVGGYAFFAFPLVVEPTWLRQITGIWWGCCSVSQALDPRALLAVAAVALGLAAGGFTLASRGRALTTLVLVVAGLVMGAVVVGKDGPDPVVLRTGELACESAGTARVCVWPEHRASLGGLAAKLPRAVETAQSLSLAIPPEFTEDAAQHLGYFTLDPAAGDAMTAYAFVLALLPDFDEQCRTRVEALPSSGAYDAVDAARAQLALALGLPRSEVRRLVGVRPGSSAADMAAVQQAILTCDLDRLSAP